MWAPYWAHMFSIAPVLHYVDNVHLLEENILDYAYVGPTNSLPTDASRVHISGSPIMSYYVLVRIVLIQCGWDEGFLSRIWHISVLMLAPLRLYIMYWPLAKGTRRPWMNIMRNGTRQNLLDGRGSRNMHRLINL